nr:hypothetical protein [uncultured Bdellovibrio sp.]
MVFVNRKLLGFSCNKFLFLIPVALILTTNWWSFSNKSGVRGLISPPAFLNHFSFGYQEVIADSIWIRAIQDFDYCEQQKSENICVDNSWLYKMIDTITELSPKFRVPYAAGALALTVIISDIEGATKIFDKGVQRFPNDWEIQYRAAYHYLYEVKDRKRAAELLIQAGQHGAPPWVFTLAGRLYSDSGHMELAESLLQEMIRNEQDPTLIKRLQDKINSMKNADSSK